MGYFKWLFTAGKGTLLALCFVILVDYGFIISFKDVCSAPIAVQIAGYISVIGATIGLTYYSISTWKKNRNNNASNTNKFE